MSLKANYFKLGLFVIGAIAAGVITLLVIGSGRWFQQKIGMETYFDESVQGLDIGSKIKYRGVVIGEVTRITFTYVYYQLDLPMSQRYKYVMVEAQIEPKLVGGRSAAGDLTSPEGVKAEIEKGLRVRLAPQGITGTSFLELDYVDPPPATLPIDWSPRYVYIPSTKSTVSQFVNAASEILDRLHKLDVEGTIANLNTLLTTTTKKIDAVDAKTISERTTRTLAKLESTLDAFDAKKLSSEGTALLAELRGSNAELRKLLSDPAWQKLPQDADAAMSRIRDLVSDPKIGATVGHLERTLARLDRLTGGGQTDLETTIANLRQITDNLRELTENAKRYPSNVLFGAPPTPLERK